MDNFDKILADNKKEKKKEKKHKDKAKETPAPEPAPAAGSPAETGKRDASRKAGRCGASVSLKHSASFFCTPRPPGSGSKHHLSRSLTKSEQKMRGCLTVVVRQPRHFSWKAPYRPLCFLPGHCPDRGRGGPGNQLHPQPDQDHPSGLRFDTNPE